MASHSFASDWKPDTSEQVDFWARDGFRDGATTDGADSGSYRVCGGSLIDS